MPLPIPTPCEWTVHDSLLKTRYVWYQNAGMHFVQHSNQSTTSDLEVDACALVAEVAPEDALRRRGDEVAA
jgi:hypothetical protein